MKIIEDIKNIKDSQDFKVFNKKYHFIAILVGMIFGAYVTLSPVDYTNEIKVKRDEIAKIKSSIETKKLDFTKTLKSEYDPKFQSVNKEIVGLDKEIASLKDEKKLVDNQVTAKLKVEQEQKRKAAEAKLKEEQERKKGKWAIQSNGYNVWEAYFTPGTYQLSVKHNGRGNCIVWTGTRDNQKQVLVVNKIGQGTFAGTFKVKTAGYYTLTFTTDSSFTFEYKGF